MILLISLLSHLALIHSTRLRQHENQFISAINVNNSQLGEPVAQLRRMSLADSSLMKTSPTVDVLSERLGLKKIKLEEIQHSYLYYLIGIFCGHERFGEPIQVRHDNVSDSAKFDRFRIRFGQSEILQKTLRRTSGRRSSLTKKILKNNSSFINIFYVFFVRRIDGRRFDVVLRRVHFDATETS